MDYKSIGKNIRCCRINLGITQQKFAEKVNLSVSYLGAIERGEKLPTLQVFINIANSLNVSADTLLADVLEKGTEIIASDLSIQIARLSKSEQQRILNVIRTMIADSY